MMGVWAMTGSTKLIDNAKTAATFLLLMVMKSG